MNKRIFTILLILCSSMSLFAQTIPVQDTAFARFLFERYPSICPAQGQLDTVLALSATGLMSMQNRAIENMDEIVYLKNVTGMLLAGNNLTSFPDIDGFPNLKFIYIEGNQIGTTPVFSNLPVFQGLSFKDNKLTAVPKLVNCPVLSFLDLQGNMLASVDGMAAIASMGMLDSVNLRYNDITMTNLIPLTFIPGYDTIFHFQKQNELSDDIWVNKYVGEDWYIESPEQGIPPLVTHSWIRGNLFNNIVPGSSNGSSFQLTNLKVWQSNIYEAIIRTNVPAWNNNWLATGEWYLTVNECPIIDSVAYHIDTLVTGLTITFDRLNVAGFVQGNFSVNLMNASGVVYADVKTYVAYSITPDKYTVQYFNGLTCNAVSDTVIELVDFPKITACVFDTVQLCGTNSLVISEINTDVPLLNASFILHNDADGASREIALNESISVDAGIYSVFVYDNDLLIDSLVGYITIENINPCNCLKPALSYKLDTTSEGVYLNVDGSAMFADEHAYQLHLVDVSGTVISALTDAPKLVGVGEYRVQYTVDELCTSLVDSVIQILPRPVVSALPYTASSTCLGTSVSFSSLQTDRPLQAPAIHLENVATHTIVPVYENEHQVVPTGKYDLWVSDNGLSLNVLADYLDVPEIDRCACLSEIGLSTEVISDCHNARLTVAVQSNPLGEQFTVYARDDVYNTDSLLTLDTATVLPFGSYSVVFVREVAGCEFVAEKGILLQQKSDCDIVLYPNDGNSMQTYFLDGNGQVKLIDEWGNVLLNVVLPTSITGVDDLGRNIPAGYYMLLFDNGNSLELTIVR